jgi:hypothetical protein
MATATQSHEKHEKVFAHCSFCAKSNTGVDRLIAGAGVYICNECVALCTAILGDTSLRGDPHAPPRLPEWEHLTDDAMLSHVTNIATTAGRVEASLHSWVAELRRRGVTWARIGESLGITRQSAWERFSPET